MGLDGGESSACVGVGAQIDFTAPMGSSLTAGTVSFWPEGSTVEAEDGMPTLLPRMGREGLFSFGSFLFLDGFASCLGVKMGLVTVVFFGSGCLGGTGIVAGCAFPADPLDEVGKVSPPSFLRGMLGSVATLTLFSIMSGSATLSLEEGVGVASMGTGSASGTEEAIWGATGTGGIVLTFLGDDKLLVGGVVGVVTFGGGGDVTMVRGGRGMEPVLGSLG